MQLQIFEFKNVLVNILLMRGVENNALKRRFSVEHKTIYADKKSKTGFYEFSAWIANAS